MELEPIKKPETAEAEKNGAMLIESARAFVILDDEAYGLAGTFLNDVTQKAKNIEAQFKEPVEKAFQAHRAMTAFRDRVLGPFKEAKMVISQKIGSYAQQKERERNAAAAKATQEARERAESERLRQAEAAEARGDKEGADALLDAPLTPKIDPSQIPQETPKVKGMTTRRAWDFTYDLEKMKADPKGREYLIADEVKMRKVVNALGDQTAIPGVTVFEKTIVGSRGTV